jgi:ribosomal protein S27AE
MKMERLVCEKCGHGWSVPVGPFPGRTSMFLNDAQPPQKEQWPCEKCGTIAYYRIHFG